MRSRSGLRAARDLGVGRRRHRHRPTARRRGARARRGRRRGGPHLQRRGARAQRAADPRGPRGERHRGAVHRRGGGGRARARTSTSSPSSWRRSSRPTRQAVPVAVQNLEQLGGLPAGVAALVGSIAVLALANALVVAVRRRRRDLAVLRAMGFTRRQTAIVGRRHGPRHRRHRRAGRRARRASRSASRCGGRPRPAPSCCPTPTCGGSSCCCPSSAPRSIALVAALVPRPPGRRAEPGRGAPRRVAASAGGVLLVPEPAEEVGAELLLVHVGGEAGGLGLRGQVGPLVGGAEEHRGAREPARRSGGWPRCR